MNAIQFLFFIMILTLIIIAAWNALKIREIHLEINTRMDQLSERLAWPATEVIDKSTADS